MFTVFGTRVNFLPTGDRGIGLALNNRGLGDFRLSKVGAGH